MMRDHLLLDELTALTCAMVAIPSTHKEPEQLRRAIDFVEKYLRSLPGLFIHCGICADKPYLVATLHDTRIPDIMFHAHLDVVPGRPEQFQPEVRNGRIYGRGAQDMKGSAAVLLRILKDLAVLPAPPNIGCMFVSDEEVGGDDGAGHLAQAGWRARFFVTAEPTDLQICYAHKGGLLVDIRLAGEPAHASRPWDSRNALGALREGMVALEQHFPTPDTAVWRTTVTPTIVRGGDVSNRLPSQVVLMLDVRSVPEDQPAAIVTAVQACFPGADVRLRRTVVPLVTDPQHPRVQQLSAAVTAITGRPAVLFREHFATDARFYSELGIPAVCLGPTGAGLHADDEWVDQASLGQLYGIFRQCIANYA